MSSPEAFVWMALHFYQPLLEPVWPARSRSACMQTHLRRTDVGHRGQRSTGGFCHTVSLSSLQLTFLVFFLYICFSSDSCVHLILRRPWQYQVAVQILQVVCCSIDYRVIIDFMWRQWLKKPFKPSCRWSVRSKVKMLKWPSDKRHHMPGQIPSEPISQKYKLVSNHAKQSPRRETCIFP